MPAKDGAYARLTEKEEEALRLVHMRLTSKQIARELGISAKSVDKRLDSARIKLGTATRVDAARLWARKEYGEPFPGEAFPVAYSENSSDLHRAGLLWNHQGGIGARMDPAKIGPLARTAWIIAGAVAIALLIVISLGIAMGLSALFESLWGPSMG